MNPHSHFSSLSTASACTTDINLPLSGVIWHLDQWIFSSLFWMYNIVDGLTPNSYSEHHYNACVNEAGLTHSFPHHRFLALQNTRQNFSTTLWGHFQWRNHQLKAQKNVKRMALSRFWKGHSFIGWELKQKAKHCLVGPQLGARMSSSSKFFVTLPMSANDHKSLASIDFVQQTLASR